jgi:hypothetical protein
MLLQEPQAKAANSLLTFRMFFPTAWGASVWPNVAAPEGSPHKANAAKHRHGLAKVRTRWQIHAGRDLRMSETNSINPNRLTIEQAAKVLSAAFRERIDETRIRQDIDQGAPLNPDGTINLVHYSAWQVKEMGHGE